MLVDEIVHRPAHTIIPTLSRRGTGIVKTYQSLLVNHSGLVEPGG